MAKKSKLKTAPKKAPAKKKALSKKPASKKPALAKKASSKKASSKKAPAPSVEMLLKAGDSAPLFRAVDENGSEVTLESLKGRITVVYFYPKDDTPGCTKEACDFRDSFSRLEGAGVRVLGVSKDSPESHRKFQSKYQLPFTLVSDQDGKVCERFGVWKEKSMYGRKYMGIERSTFVIGPDLKILKVYPKVSVTGHVEEVLADLRTLRES